MDMKDIIDGSKALLRKGRRAITGTVAGLALIGLVGAAEAQNHDFTECAALPGVAYAQGARNTFWIGDIKLANPSGETLSGELVFTPRGTASGGEHDVTVGYVLGPNETMRLPEAYHLAFTGKGIAVAYVCPDEGSAMPDARLVVNNRQPDSEEAYGQSMKNEAWSHEGDTDAFMVNELGERANPIIVTGAEPVTLTVETYRAGTLVNTREAVFPANMYTQLNSNQTQTGLEALAGIPLGPNDLVKISTDGSYVGWVSVVNNVTGDAYTERLRQNE